MSATKQKKNTFHFLFTAAVLSISLFFPNISLAALHTTTTEQVVATENPIYVPDTYYRAKVLTITEQGTKKAEDGTDRLYQKVHLQILDGDEKGAVHDIEYGNDYPLRKEQLMKVGEQVVVIKSNAYDTPTYLLQDQYRLSSIGWLFAVFFILVLVFGGKRGLGSMIGLATTIAVLIWYIVPHIYAGENPIFVSIIGSIMIIFSSIYFSHGFSKRTSVAVLSMLITLCIAALLSVIATNTAKLFGIGSEEAFYLSNAIGKGLNLKGLFLAGMIIGTLGVLDDITIGQSAAIDEIYETDPTLTFKELYKKGASVGHEHISSLVNTLALAYAGSALPLFILFVTDKTRPAWVIMNSGTIAEEIIRTLVGSMSLLFAVPITTILAAYFLSRTKKHVITQ